MWREKQTPEEVCANRTVRTYSAPGIRWFLFITPEYVTVVTATVTSTGLNCLHESFFPENNMLGKTCYKMLQVEKLLKI